MYGRNFEIGVHEVEENDEICESHLAIHYAFIFYCVLCTWHFIRCRPFRPCVMPLSFTVYSVLGTLNWLLRHSDIAACAAISPQKCVTNRHFFAHCDSNQPLTCPCAVI